VPRRRRRHHGRSTPTPGSSPARGEAATSITVDRKDRAVEASARYELSCLVAEDIGREEINHYEKGMYALLEVVGPPRSGEVARRRAILLPFGVVCLLRCCERQEGETG